MPRPPRIEAAGIPLHVTQRGVNHAAIFVDDDDRRHFLALLHGARRRHAVDLHAWVLMGNHVHLLLQGQAPGAIGLAMKSLGQQYVQAFNHRHGRSGALWQGRFKSSPVGDDHHLLTVVRYIELNPVRAGLATAAVEWPWSSARRHLGLGGLAPHEPHPVFEALGANVVARARAWSHVLAQAVDPKESALIRLHLARERPFGDPRFTRMLAAALGRPVQLRGRGRPARSVDKVEDVQGRLHLPPS